MPRPSFCFVHRYRFFRRGQVVVDLGAAPGGWSLIAAQRVAAPQSGRIVSIDLLPGSFAECVRVSVLVLLTKRCSGPQSFVQVNDWRLH